MDTRQRILDAVRAEPGVTLTDLRDRADVSWSALYAHLRHLEAEGKLHRRTVAGRRLVFQERSDERLATAYAQMILGREATRQIARLVADGEAPDVEGIVARTGIAPRGVRHHLRRLLRAGLATSASPHRYVRL